MAVTWTLSRDKFCTGTGTVRMLKFLQVVKEALEAAGWVLKGNGDGVDGFDMQTVGAATNHWATFASGTTGLAAGAWYCHENSDGAHLVLFSDSVSGTQVGMWYSASGGYTSGMGEGISARVGTSTPPADERQVVIQTSASAEASGGADYYANVAMSSDGNSVIAWGFRALPQAETALIFAKFDGSKTGDVEPYVGYRFGATAADVWLVSDLSDVPTNLKAYHTTAGLIDYMFSEPAFGGTDIMDTIPVDPYTSNHNTLQVLLGSDVGGGISIRGVVPGVRRVSSALSQGDLIGTNGAFVVVGDYGMPWNSVSAPSM